MFSIRLHHIGTRTRISSLKTCRATDLIEKPNDLPQPQPPGSQATTKPSSSESPAATENKRDGGCWLQGAGSASWDKNSLTTMITAPRLQCLLCCLIGPQKHEAALARRAL